MQAVRLMLGDLKDFLLPISCHVKFYEDMEQNIVLDQYIHLCNVNLQGYRFKGITLKPLRLIHISFSYEDSHSNTFRNIVEM